MPGCYAGGRGRLKGIFLCSVNLPELGGGAFIKAGAFIRMFTVCCVKGHESKLGSRAFSENLIRPHALASLSNEGLTNMITKVRAWLSFE